MRQMILQVPEGHGSRAAAVEEELAVTLRRELADRFPEIVPLVDLTVLTPP